MSFGCPLAKFPLANGIFTWPYWQSNGNFFFWIDFYNSFVVSFYFTPFFSLWFFTVCMLLRPFVFQNSRFSILCAFSIKYFVSVSAKMTNSEHFQCNSVKLFFSLKDIPGYRWVYYLKIRYRKIKSISVEIWRRDIRIIRRIPGYVGNG